MGLNRLGTSQVSELRQTRCVAMFSRFVGSNVSTAPNLGSFRDLGECSSISVGSDRQTISKFSDRKGLRNRIAEAVSSVEKGPVNFTLAEGDLHNTAMILSGNITNQTNDLTAGTNFYTLGEHTAGYGRWYELRDETGARIYDLGTGTITVGPSGATFRITVGGVEATTVVDTLNANGFPAANNFYPEVMIDRAAGLVFIPSYFGSGTNIGFGAVAFQITTGITGRAADIQRVAALGGTYKGKLKLRVHDAWSDKGIAYEEYIFPNVEIIQNGDFEILSDADFNEMSFSALVSNDTNGVPFYYETHINADAYETSPY